MGKHKRVIIRSNRSPEETAARMAEMRARGDSMRGVVAPAIQEQATIVAPAGEEVIMPEVTEEVIVPELAPEVTEEVIVPEVIAEEVVTPEIFKPEPQKRRNRRAKRERDFRQIGAANVAAGAFTLPAALFGMDLPAIVQAGREQRFDRKQGIGKETARLINKGTTEEIEDFREKLAARGWSSGSERGARQDMALADILRGVAKKEARIEFERERRAAKDPNDISMNFTGSKPMSRGISKMAAEQWDELRGREIADRNARFGLETARTTAESKMLQQEIAAHGKTDGVQDIMRDEYGQIIFPKGADLRDDGTLLVDGAILRPMVMPNGREVWQRDTGHDKRMIEDGKLSAERAKIAQRERELQGKTRDQLNEAMTSAIAAAEVARKHVADLLRSEDAIASMNSIMFANITSADRKAAAEALADRFGLSRDAVGRAISAYRDAIMEIDTVRRVREKEGFGGRDGDVWKAARSEVKATATPATPPTPPTQ